VPPVARLVFAVALIFTAIGVIESAFIVYEYFTGALAYERAPDRGIGIRSWTEHHALRPGYDIPNLHTNSFGLRSPEVAVPKPAGTVRILLLGDSFTFGQGVREDQGFARVLERKLKATETDRVIEVVNAGVISYCPLLEYLQYRQHLHILEPDLVVLNFDMSDVQDHLIYSRTTAWSSDGAPLFSTEPSLQQVPGLMPPLLSFQWVSRRLRALRREVTTIATDVPVHDVDRYAWTLDGGPELAREAEAAMSPIANLQTLLAHAHIPLVLATYPQPWQVSKDATPLPPIREQYGVGLGTVHLNDRPFRQLERFASDRSIPFLNATPRFRTAEQPAALFLRDDFHFSPSGNDLYADVLASLVRAQLQLH